MATPRKATAPRATVRIAEFTEPVNEVLDDDATELPTSSKYTFEDVIVKPASREPNPFDGVVGSLVVNSGKGKAFTVNGTASMSKKDGAKQKSYDNPELRTIRRQLTEAADALPTPVTVRMTVRPTEDGNARVEIKAISKMVRPARR